MERTPGRILLSPEKLWNTRDCQVFPPFLGPVLKNNNEVSGKAVVYEIRREAKEIIDFVEEEIANIDDQILELQRKREELVQEGIPSWTILDACKVALSPFRRVPMEILQHIAVDALPAFPSPALNQSPMSLSHVCKNWRNAVLAFPEAWAALYLNIDIVHCNNLSWSSCVVTNWFDRAPNRPLSLYLHFDDETLGTQWPLDSLRAFFETLQPYFNRIHHLGLSADLTLQYAGFLNRHAFPNLRSLTMNITQYRRITDTVSQGSGEELTFEEAPRLRKLCLNDPAPLQLEFLDLEDATSPWSQITDLCLTKAIPLGDWLLILQICPHLRKATFYIEEGFGSHNVSIDEEFDHSALEDLRLNINDATLYLQPCFEMCSFPRLRTLHIYHCNDIVDIDIMSFPPEFSSLKTLVVTGDWYQSLDILELLLNSTSGLANLTLGTAVSDTSIFQVLTLAGDDRPEEEDDSDTAEEPNRFLVPNLSTLTLVITLEDDDLLNFFESFEVMLYSRTYGVAEPSQRLKKLCIVDSFNNDTVLEKIESILDLYCEDGYDFQVGEDTDEASCCDCTECQWECEVGRRMARKALKRAKRRVEANP